MKRANPIWYVACLGDERGRWHSDLEHDPGDEQMQLRLRFTAILLPLAVVAGCSSSDVPGGTSSDPDVVLQPGKQVTLALGAVASEQKEALDQELDQVEALSPAEFANNTRVEFEPLGYDPKDAIGLDLIAESPLGLSDAELAKLSSNGFVISKENGFPTFAYGYASIYSNDLPVYVSADSILGALHISYDNILAAFESQSLLPALEDLLAGLLTKLDQTPVDAENRADLDVYLTVAASLLANDLVEPLDDDNKKAVKDLYEGCQAATGAANSTLFGINRTVDFSQFEPRGHYTDRKELERYFRAMMWLGRIDFRMIETQSDGSSLFHRRQLVAALMLDELMTNELRATQQSIDSFITAFVGEHDYMTVPQLAQLKEDLEISQASELADLDDQTIAQAIVDGGYGTQRISSHYMVNGAGGTLPLSSSFAFFGQRYVLDSHVFSNVVYDRVPSKRMMPSPLDVAYAALGNDQAGMMLKSELERYNYASDLEAMRVIADEEPSAFWEQNLYNRWLGALRTLSPASALTEGADEALPAIAKTEAWGARLLNTQLASWAELRHDTILYAKQSYTSGDSCEFPDAYVEPYPAFFASMEEYAEHAQTLIAGLSFEAPEGTTQYFETFGSIARTLREMAEHQRTGTPHSEAHLAFINRAVHVNSYGCGGPDTADGWYADLVYGQALQWAPTIADVHTQPTDETGADVGRVLHVGTGETHLMITTVETCSGPRAYAGLVSSYYETIEEDWKRLTDPEWSDRLFDDPPAPPAWAEALMAE